MMKPVNGSILGRMTTAHMTFNEFNAIQKREADERHAPVIEAYSAGKTLEQVAAEFGITKARVHQIVKRAEKRGLLPKRDA